MVILAALIALGSRFATKILTTALGWATTLPFGRVPAPRQIALLAITFGSVIWAVLVVGVIVPDVGTFLLLFVPAQDIVPEVVIRAAMLVGALVVPGVVGFLILWLSPAADRRGKAAIASVLRGYPVTALLAALLVFLAGLAIYRKAWSLARRWTDAHVPLVVEPGHYEDVARDLDEVVHVLHDEEGRPSRRFRLGLRVGNEMELATRTAHFARGLLRFRDRRYGGRARGGALRFQLDRGPAGLAGDEPASSGELGFVDQVALPAAATAHLDLQRCASVVPSRKGIGSTARFSSRISK
jgi:hypothetical protein